MKQNPELDNNVVERPRNEVTEGTIEAVRLGTIKELWEYEDEEEDLPEWANLDDQRLQIDIEVEYGDKTFVVTDDIAYYDEPTDGTAFGKFIQRYDGTPEQGMSVDVNFDEDGNGSIVGIRE